MAHLTSIVTHLDDRLQIAEHPDYGGALNGLQVSGPVHIGKVAASVDVSMEVVDAAIESGADLLVVHHGLFWGGVRPLVGVHFEKLRRMIEGGLGLWACHLPLDGDAEFGNAALLTRAMGFEPLEPFGDYKGASIGWSAKAGVSRDELMSRIGSALGGAAQLIDGGPEEVDRIAVVTGSGASFIPAAVDAGIRTLVTGEASHHAYVEAKEAGVNLILGGHYRTETFGVRSVGQHLASHFSIEFEFLDFPSGL